MNDSYDPRSFWDERFIKYGHTGEADQVLYAHDQPQRLRAIARALSRASISITPTTRILDFGCGTGDFIQAFIRQGASEIVGIDLSEETINYARSRFTSNPQLRFFTVGVEDMDFPSDSFDLAVGINVLQHVTDERAFSQAVKNVARVVRAGGHVLVMDFSPLSVRERHPDPCIVIRARQEYIDTFQGYGCRFVGEYGLPRIGVRLYRTVVRIVRRLLRPSSKDVTKETSREMSAESARSRLHALIRFVVLKLTWPFDYLLAPFPARCTDMSILIFIKLPGVTPERDADG